jgi:hypothetical protein
MDLASATHSDFYAPLQHQPPAAWLPQQGIVSAIKVSWPRSAAAAGMFGWANVPGVAPGRFLARPPTRWRPITWSMSTARRRTGRAGRLRRVPVAVIGAGRRQERASTLAVAPGGCLRRAPQPHLGPVSCPWGCIGSGRAARGAGERSQSRQPAAGPATPRRRRFRSARPRPVGAGRSNHASGGAATLRCTAVNLVWRAGVGGVVSAPALAGDVQLAENTSGYFGYEGPSWP